MSKDINKTDEQGRKQGHWVEEDDDGSVFEGPYVDDKQHGQWVVRLPNGKVVKETYRNGEEVN